MIRWPYAVLALAIACGAAASAQQPARDTARRALGGTIAGVVVTGDSVKLPARRVRVTLTDLSGRIPGRTTTTDDAGAFSFRGLPAGRFDLQAFKNAYLRASYGASRPDRTGTPIVLNDGDAVTNLSMTIVRGGVITGIVRDPRGRPVPGVNVRVLKIGYTAATGEPTLVAAGSGSAAFTDDRGEYRAYGLPPGGYLVLVPPGPASARSDDTMRQLTRADVQRAAPTAVAARVDYAPVFYPSATDIRAAATIALAVSEERTGVDITMQLVPTATISGTVTAPAGALPQFLSVRLAPASGQVSMRAGAGLRALSTQPAADGRYLFTNVPPGSYTIKAVVGGGRGAPANIPKQWAAAEVNVSGQDLDVPLSLQPAVAVNGHVVFEGAQPTAADLQALSVTLVPPGTGGTPQNDGGGHVDGDGRFTFAGLTPDTYQFVTTWTSARARDTWTLKASTVNGRDAFESPLRVNPNEKLDWTLTFTDTPTTLTGTLKDTSGRPATDYYMLIFSTDRLYWIPGSRRVRMTRPATDGSYTVKGLPAGEYYLAAPADLENGEWNDPSLLERLAASSARITLRDGETTVRDFRIGGP